MRAFAWVWCSYTLILTLFFAARSAEAQVADNRVPMKPWPADCFSCFWDIAEGFEIRHCTSDDAQLFYMRCLESCDETSARQSLIDAYAALCFKRAAVAESADLIVAE